MPRSIAAVAAALTLALTTPAAADYQQDADAFAKVAQDIAVGSLQRARQAIAIGPFVGAFVGASEGESISGISFGLGLFTFDRPSILQLRQIVEEKLRARVKEHIAAVIASGGAAPDERDVLAKVVADVKAEILGEARVKTFEKPSLGVVLEGAVISPAGWSTRLGVSKGIGPASLGLGTGIVRAGGDTIPFVGLDLSVRATPTGVHRTPVIEVYARADLGFADAGRTGTFLGGVRVLLDLL